MPNNFEQAAVGRVDVFVLDVENGVDEVLAQQRPETVLPAISVEHGAVIRSALAGEVHFGGPPSSGSVFEFNRAAGEWVSKLGRCLYTLEFDFEISRLFEGVGISDEIGPLLSRS